MWKKYLFFFSLLLISVSQINNIGMIVSLAESSQSIATNEQATLTDEAPLYKWILLKDTDTAAPTLSITSSTELNKIHLIADDGLALQLDNDTAQYYQIELDVLCNNESAYDYKPRKNGLAADAENQKNAFNTAFHDPPRPYPPGHVIHLSTFQYNLNEQKWINNEVNSVYLRSADGQEIPTFNIPGYPHSLYFELTEGGYRLLDVYRASSSHRRVSINTTRDEIEASLPEFVTYSSDPSEVDKSKLDYDLIDTDDTATPGKKLIKITESLHSASTHAVDFDFDFYVNGLLEESFYDTEGNEIQEKKQHDIPYDSQHNPNTDIDDPRYQYVGWLPDNEIPGQAPPHTGAPPVASGNAITKYNYIYQLDEGINITIPTEMFFGTFNDTTEAEKRRDIRSSSYAIKNNASDKKIEVTLEEFKLENNPSTIQLLEQTTEDPNDEQQQARLHVNLNNQQIISSLTEHTSNINLCTLNPNTEAALSFSGKYFGNFNNQYQINHTMLLKFSVAD